MQTGPETTFDPYSFLGMIDVQSAVSIAFLVLFIVWALYTIISAYHWIRYGHSSAIAIPALTVHVVVSWLLAGYAASGLIG